MSDVALGDLVLLPEGIEGLDLSDLLDQRELLLRHLSHLDRDQSACHLTNFAHLNLFDVLQDGFFLKGNEVGAKGLLALCLVKFDTSLLHRLSAFGVSL